MLRSRKRKDNTDGVILNYGFGSILAVQPVAVSGNIQGRKEERIEHPQTAQQVSESKTEPMTSQIRS
jgi:hypothetical protein